MKVLNLIAMAVNRKWVRGILKGLLVGIPIVLSVIALIEARHARQDARLITGLDLRPVVRISATFANDQNKPSFLDVWNDGPVEALQVEIQVYIYRYWARYGKVRSVTGDSMNSQLLAKLEPLQEIQIQLDQRSVSGSWRLAQSPDADILGIRVLYRRPSDRRRFVEEAFYFIDPNGRWVTESNQSIASEYYAKLKASVLEFAVSTGDFRYPGDRLHPIE